MLFRPVAAVAAAFARAQVRAVYRLCSVEAVTLKLARALAPLRLRRAEAILRGRSGAIALVLDRTHDEHNIHATVRSADALGVQYVFQVINPLTKSKLRNREQKQCGQEEQEDGKEQQEEQEDEAAAFGRRVTKASSRWLTVRTFRSPAAAIVALKQLGWKLLVTDLSPEAQPLHLIPRSSAAAASSSPGSFPPDPIPERLALVVGREVDGVSDEFLRAADYRVFLPMFGFSESFNVSVATALILQRLFDWHPRARGSLEPAEMERLRREWYEQLATTPAARAQFAPFLADPSLVEPLHDLRVGRNQEPKTARIAPKKRKLLALAEARVAAEEAMATATTPTIPSLTSKQL